MKFIQTWAMQRWLDMGMATLIFTVHTNRKGQLVADVSVNPIYVYSRFRLKRCFVQA